MIDPRFPVLASLNVIGFLTLHLHRVVDASPSAWTGRGRLAYDRLESACEALDAARLHRFTMSRTEASTLLAFAQRLMEGREPYDRSTLVYTGCDDDFPRQEALWAQAQAETHYPPSLPALIARLEVIAGLRQTLPGLVQSRNPGRFSATG